MVRGDVSSSTTYSVLLLGMLDDPDVSSVSVGHRFEQRGTKLRPQGACSLGSNLECEDLGWVAQSCAVAVRGDRVVRGLVTSRSALVSRWMMEARFPIAQWGVSQGVGLSGSAHA